MSVPTRADTYAKLLEHLRLAQEDAAMLSHLHAMEGGSPGSAESIKAKGWLVVSEALKLMQHKATEIATKGLQ